MLKNNGGSGAEPLTTPVATLEDILRQLCIDFESGCDEIECALNGHEMCRLGNVRLTAQSIRELVLDKVIGEKRDESGGWATLPSGQTVQDKDVANWNRGYNQALSDISKELKEL